MSNGNTAKHALRPALEPVYCFLRKVEQQNSRRTNLVCRLWAVWGVWGRRAGQWQRRRRRGGCAPPALRRPNRAPGVVGGRPAGGGLAGGLSSSAARPSNGPSASNPATAVVGPVGVPRTAARGRHRTPRRRRDGAARREDAPRADRPRRSTQLCVAVALSTALRGAAKSVAGHVRGWRRWVRGAVAVVPARRLTRRRGCGSAVARSE